MRILIQSTAVLAALPILAFAAPAFAAASVSVEVTSRAGHAGSAQCSYYGNTTNGCQNIGDGPSGYTSSGSLSTNGGNGAFATRATASTGQSGTDYGQTLPEATSISATADLTTGSLHMQSLNTSGYPASSYGSDGYASLSDVLHFSVAGASPTTVTGIMVSFTIDGTLASPAGMYPTAGGGDFYGLMTFGSSAASFNFTNDATTDFKTLGTFGTGASSYPGTWTYASDYSTATYTETYDITGAQADIAVYARANMDCGNGSSCLYGNTAKFLIGSPTGTTFTSDSGVFLTGGVSAAPEPTIWALMLIGIGAVGAALRQRRRGYRAACA